MDKYEETLVEKIETFDMFDMWLDTQIKEAKNALSAYKIIVKRYTYEEQILTDRVKTLEMVKRKHKDLWEGK